MYALTTTDRARELERYIRFVRESGKCLSLFERKRYFHRRRTNTHTIQNR